MAAGTASSVAVLRDAGLRSAPQILWGGGGQEVRIGLQQLIRTPEIKMLKLDHTDAPTTDDEVEG
jgi:hypothetical protein